MATGNYLQGQSRSVPSIRETHVFVNLDLGSVREGGVGDAGREMIGEQVEAAPSESWSACREEHGSSLDLVKR